MISKESEALILRTHRLAEADKIVLFYSRKAGLVRGVARGARRLKNRFGAGLEPFTKVSIAWVEKEERELVSIRQVEIRRSYFALSRVPEIWGALERISSYTIFFAQPHQPDERLYRMIAACVEALSRRPEVSEALTTYYELWFLKLGGFLPDLSSCGRCGGDLTAGRTEVAVGVDGVLFCSHHSAAGLQKLTRDAVERLNSFRREGPQKWAELFLREDGAIKQQAASYSAGLISRYTGLQHRCAR